MGARSHRKDPGVPTTASSWELNFNVSWNENKITELQEPSAMASTASTCYEEGNEMGAFHTVRFTGVDPATGDVCASTRTRTAQPAMTPTTAYRGQSVPGLLGWVDEHVLVPGFDLRTFLQFSQGGEIYNGLRAYADDGGLSRFDNKLQSVMRRWRQPGDVTDVPRASRPWRIERLHTTSRWIEDASYIRLQEITLGYRVPARFASKANISDARLFVSGRNLKTWQDFTGFNPDANSAGPTRTRRSQRVLFVPAGADVHLRHFGSVLAVSTSLDPPALTRGSIDICESDGWCPCFCPRSRRPARTPHFQPANEIPAETAIRDAATACAALAGRTTPCRMTANHDY